MEKTDFKNIVDNLCQAVIVTDKNRIITYANNYFCELFNTVCQKLEGKSFYEFMPQGENEIQIKDNLYTVKTMDCNDYFVFIFSEQNRMEAVFADFISTISHELRTPLTSIRGFADTMLMSFEKLDSQQLKKFLSIIKEQSNRLIKLIENLLSVAKMQSQEETLVYKSVDVKQSADTFIPMLKNQYKTHNFIVNCEANLPPILVDESKFQQIMINLLDNAAKYSSDNSVVEIIGACANHENFVSIKIVDHGTGIAPENLNKVFDKFSRIENHLTSKTQGSGLGLFIVKNLVDKMGGKITVTSCIDGKDKGSVFEILFPASSYTNQCCKKLSGDK